MNKKIKMKWVKALNSGKYRKAVGALCMIDSQGHASYCCLGVLCDLAVKAGVKVNVYSHSETGRKLFDGDCNTLPSKVRKWAGLSDSNPIVDLPNGQCQSLADCNDGYDGGRPMRHKTIAKLIEASL